MHIILNVIPSENIMVFPKSKIEEKNEYPTATKWDKAKEMMKSNPTFGSKCNESRNISTEHL